MKILLTGITGFIGGHLARELIARRAHVVALVRPHTAAARYREFAPHVRILPLELTDRTAVQRVLASYPFDGVLHLAACRGTGKVTREVLRRSNIDATRVLAQAARAHGVQFVFCSTAGVFGTIPADLPPDEKTPYHADNDYHATKIEAERQLDRLTGLCATIIRPPITYGTGDDGFPYLLIKLIDRGLLLLPSRDILLHMVDVHTLVEAFIQAASRPSAGGRVYTVADLKPISLVELTDHIARRLTGRPYPRWKRLPNALYHLAEDLCAHVLGSQTWATRVRLLTRDRYYDGAAAARELSLCPHETLPYFDEVLRWYQKRQTR